MNKRNISKLLIFLITASLGAVKVYGYAESEQSVLTDVQPAVAIEKQTSSIENASANGETGAHTGLQSVFSIQTNGNDNDYDFIITSKILTDGEKFLHTEIMEVFYSGIRWQHRLRLRLIMQKQAEAAIKM